MLHIIRADAGSDKSAYLTHFFANEAAKNPQVNYVYIVPEQFTMFTQKQMVMACESRTIMNIDVLSFNRLAYRVFEELGTRKDTVLMETGKNLLLRKVAQEKSDELLVLGTNMKRPGYITQMKSLISEMIQYQITTDNLAELITRKDISESFRYKAKDLLTMYCGFNDIKRDKFITSEELLEILTGVIEDSELLRNAVIAFDGFTGFTPLQLSLLERILPMVSDAYVTITIGDDEELTSADDKVDDYDLFAMSRNMYNSLDRICQKCNIKMDTPKVASMKRIHKEKGCLDRLHRSLFRDGELKEIAACSGDRIDIVRTPSPKQEVRYVAVEINRLIREEGLRYKDIAVVCASLEDYRYLVEDIFAEFNIPAFIDSNRGMQVNPLLEYLMGFLEVIESDFQYDAVMKYLRSGLSDITAEESDLFENYLLATGIRGRRKYSKPFNYKVRNINDDEKRAKRLEIINDIRKRVYEELEPVLALESTGTILDFTRGCYRQLKHVRAYSKLKNRAEAYEAGLDSEKAREYEAIYDKVTDLFEKMAAILGDEQVEIKEFTELVQAGIESFEIGIIPPNYDSVTVGDIERTRLENIKALFLVGAGDNNIPKKEAHGGLLSQMDRQMLFENEIILSPTDRLRQAQQRYYLYLLVSRPSDALYITFSNTDTEGKGVTQSYFIDEVLSLFPDLKVTDRFDIASDPLYFSEQYIREYAAAVSSAYLNFEIDRDSEDLGLLAALMSDDTDEYNIHNLVREAESIRNRADISPDIIKAIIRDGLRASASALEKYAACPYSYFLRYILRLEDRLGSELSPIDMGDLYHLALDYYSEKVRLSQYTWHNIPDDVSDSFLQEAIERALRQYEDRSLNDNLRELFIIEQIKQVLKRTVWTIRKQVAAGSFEPYKFEVEFKRCVTVSELDDELDSADKVNMTGKIDRIDTYEKDSTVYVKIIDYKSSKHALDQTKIYNGLQVQLIMYLDNAVNTLQRENYGKDIRPAACFYYQVHDPILDIAGLPAEEDFLKELKVDGYYCNDNDVLEALDNTGAKESLVVPLKYNKGGSISKNNRNFDQKQIDALIAFTNRKIGQTASDIYGGDFSISPYKIGEETGCSLCDYKSVCCFERGSRGMDYRLCRPGNILEQENDGGEED